MEHTKEPWVVQCFSRKMSVEGNLHIVANTDRYPTAFVPAWNDPMPGEVNAAEEAEANARRIVDCVNALAGIADPAAYVATTTDLQARLDAAEAHLDAVLNVADEAYRKYSGEEFDGFDDDDTATLQAARDFWFARTPSDVLSLRDFNCPPHQHGMAAAGCARDGVQPSINALRDFSAGLIFLSEESPRNLTLSQMTFFMTAAMADMAGRAATFSELREAVGPAVGRSLHSTYKIFLKEGRMRSGVRHDGIGWLDADTDPQDNRRKYLKLTKRGRRVVDDVLRAIEMRNT